MPFGESLEGMTRLSRGTAGQSMGCFHTFSYFLGLLLFMFFFFLGFSNVLLCSSEGFFCGCEAVLSGGPQWEDHTVVLGRCRGDLTNWGMSEQE